MLYSYVFPTVSVIGLQHNLFSEYFGNYSTFSITNCYLFRSMYSQSKFDKPCMQNIEPTNDRIVPKMFKLSKFVLDKNKSTTISTLSNADKRKKIWKRNHNVVDLSSLISSEKIL